MTKKLTQEKAEQKSLYVGCRLIGKYQGNNIKTEFECSECDEQFKRIPSSVWCGQILCWDCGQKKRIKSRSIPLHKQSLGYLYPEMVKLWSDKNIMSPFKICSQSNKKYWFRCDNGLDHEYKISLNNKIGNGQKCSYCSGHKILHGYNDLASQKEYLLAEWDYLRNDILGIYPEEVTCGSNKKVWWVCKLGHEWRATINNRVNQNQGCPYCSGHRAWSGYNDLASQNPKLTSELYYKNKLKPTEITCNSGRKVWWECSKCGYKWRARIIDRSNGGGCPNCCPKSYVVEQIKQLLNDWNVKFEIEKKFKTCKNKLCLPFDFYLYDYNLLIEYNGEQHYKRTGWDKNEDKLVRTQLTDSIKREWCQQNNIDLLIISYTDKDIELILKNKLKIKELI